MYPEIYVKIWYILFHYVLRSRLDVYGNFFSSTRSVEAEGQTDLLEVSPVLKIINLRKYL